jgi:hypothetical protein
MCKDLNISSEIYIYLRLLELIHNHEIKKKLLSISQLSLIYSKTEVIAKTEIII